MRQLNDLTWWRQGADSCIDPLGDVIKTAQTNRNSLDNDYPAWKEVKECLGAGRYPEHEARREYFTHVRVVLQNAQLSYMFIRDQLCDEKWWKEKANNFRLDLANDIIREYAIMTKFATIHSLAACTEETFRAIVRAAPQTFTVPPSAKFKFVYEHVFSEISLKRYTKLFDVLRLTRNTIHTNGVFFPVPNSKTGLREDVIVEYEGQRFSFEVSKGLLWFGEWFLPWFGTKINEAMISIVTSPLCKPLYIAYFLFALYILCEVW